MVTRNNAQTSMNTIAMQWFMKENKSEENMNKMKKKYY